MSNDLMNYLAAGLAPALSDLSNATQASPLKK